MKPSSLVGLLGVATIPLTTGGERRGVGGDGRILPSIERCLPSEEGDLGDLEALASRSLALMRSATVPARRRAALWGLGGEVKVSALLEEGAGLAEGANLALR